MGTNFHSQHKSQHCEIFHQFFLSLFYSPRFQQIIKVIPRGPIWSLLWFDLRPPHCFAEETKSKIDSVFSPLYTNWSFIQLTVSNWTIEWKQMTVIKSGPSIFFGVAARKLGNNSNANKGHENFFLVFLALRGRSLPVHGQMILCRTEATLSNLHSTI